MQPAPQVAPHPAIAQALAARRQAEAALAAAKEELEAAEASVRMAEEAIRIRESSAADLARHRAIATEEAADRYLGRERPVDAPRSDVAAAQVLADEAREYAEGAEAALPELEARREGARLAASNAANAVRTATNHQLRALAEGPLAELEALYPRYVAAFLEVAGLCEALHHSGPPFGGSQDLGDRLKRLTFQLPRKEDLEARKLALRDLGRRLLEDPEAA